jgi:hypothetical protein
VGAVAVIDWGGGKGHVGFVVGRSGNRIVLAGGNQGNAVKYSTYRLDQIAGFRAPAGYQVAASAYCLPAIDIRAKAENLASTR